MKFITQHLVRHFCASALIGGATIAGTQVSATDLDNWRSGHGDLSWKAGSEELCWRSSSWTPATAVEGCDGVLNLTPTSVVKAEVERKSPQPAREKVATNNSGSSGMKSAAVVPVPAIVDSKGVSVDKTTYAADTFFAFAKAALRPEGKRELDGLLEKIKGLKLEVVIAVGHADSVGSDAVNDRLSIARAQTVQAYLVQKGVSKDLIKIDGQGKRHPVATNKTAQGRAKNRRVEVELIALPRS
jgi:OOP family OmpA-OmpF porin